MTTIATGLTERLDEVGKAMIDRYRAEILDYGVLGEEILYGDVLANSLRNLRALIKNLSSGELVTPEDLEQLREQAARRVHQGISLESLLHSYRLWGQMVWSQMLDTVRSDPSEARDAALELAARVMEYVDFVSIAAAQAYLDEAQGVWSDREVVRRDLLEALLSEHSSAERLVRQAAALGVVLADNYVVVVARRGEFVADSMPSDERSPIRLAMSNAAEQARHGLQTRYGRPLVGMRQDEVVGLVPVQGAGELRRVEMAADTFAVSVPKFGVGIGSWHAGLKGVPASYAEAREAAEIALLKGADGRAFTFQDVLVDHMLLTSPYASRLVDDTIAPLNVYDEERGSELVETLRSYVESGFSLSKSAARLYVHANTVVYRLRRIHQLTGYDPHSSSDVMMLSLGMKLLDLRKGPAARG